MRTVVSSGPNQFEIAEVPVPRPSASEMVLGLTFCGLCGTDLYKIEHASHVGAVLGHEIVGTVEALGDQASEFSEGERVVTPHHVACGMCRLCRAGAPTRCATFQEDLLAPGGFSEKIVVRERAVRLAARRLPDQISNEAACFLEPAACVLRGIVRSGLEDVAAASLPVSALILGGGSMGLLHLLVLRALFPDAEILLAEPSRTRRQTALALGATAAFGPGELAEEVGQVADGTGVDAAFDTVGDPLLLNPTLSLLRCGGTMVLFAHSRSRHRIAAPHDELFHDERRVVGTYSGTLVEQDRIFRMLADGRLDPEPLVTHRLPLSRFDEALELVSKPSTLKILLTPG